MPPAPTTSAPAPTPVPALGPTGAALAGYRFDLTQGQGVSQSSAQFTVPRPNCTTPGEQAIALGVGGQVDAAAAPASTAVVIVGCHGANAPFAVRRVRVGNFQAAENIAFGAHVTVERTSSGYNAATTVDNLDIPSPLPSTRYILAVGGSHDTTVTYGAFGILGTDGAPLPVPQFSDVAFTHNLLHQQPLVGGTAVATPSAHVTASGRNAAGDFTLTYRR